MNSAFGIPVCPESANADAPISGSSNHGSVCFSKLEQGWCGWLYIRGITVSETIGSSSPEACYRSLRSRVRNLMRGLGRLGVKP